MHKIHTEYTSSNQIQAKGKRDNKPTPKTKDNTLKLGKHETRLNQHLGENNLKHPTTTTTAFPCELD